MQKKKVAFRPADIDHYGKIKWLVSSGADDFGTELVWQTPYRAGRVIGFESPNSYGVLFNSCEKKGRDLILGRFYEPAWRVTLPKKAKLVPQPEGGVPTLFIQQSDFKGTFVKVEAKQAEKKISHGDTPPQFQKSFDLNSLRSNWQIHPRGAYEISSNNVSTGFNKPSGLAGACRYLYRGYEHNPEIGALECFNVHYRWFYVPLNCVGEKN